MKPGRWRAVGVAVAAMPGVLAESLYVTAPDQAGIRAELLERFELDPTKQIRAYSKGNRQKVALVAAFASDVDL